ncbi:dehalogenase [Dehalococcoides mccartyi CG1]|jgi:reductive dehalogenase|uniref:reductive dehalogenase n=1 Tax=Dehalococcoides mccartyi TaxID=61435 RepID=UPI0004E0447D|nr:reductive dehalogenase [Dehalococcoides mccartyi]AII58451.1 dehalogenase [Dehalococcoides mccartyi CG1]
MAKSHSTVSRRDFMKAVGLGAAGVGSAVASAPLFHDLDELLSSEKAVWKRPWYVKEREIDNPTLEVDWKTWSKPFDCNGFLSWKDKPGFSYDQFNATVENYCKIYWPEWKGYTLRDHAMYEAFQAVRSHLATGLTQGVLPWKPARSPEQLGFSKWQGSPEDNLRMIRAALSLFGMGPVGIMDLKPNSTRNFVYDRTARGIKIVWKEGIEKNYKENNTHYIPASHRYAIVSYNPEPSELLMRTPHKLAAGAASFSYIRTAQAKAMTEAFLAALGYNCFYAHEYQPAAPFGIFAGIGENARMGQTIISPDFPYGRTHCVVYTDLPLAPTNPIDAGIPRFCETCGICAESCPVGAISEKSVGMSYDMATPLQRWGEDWNGNIPGYKGWRCDTWKCDGPCQSCRGSCPFNSVADGSFIHGFVKATVSTTPLLNGTFANMEKFMHYGKVDKDPESWWEDDANRWTYGTHGSALFTGGN